MSLFKYMSDKIAPLFAKTLQVRFTQPSDLNDPFEFRPLIDFEGTAEELRGVVDAKLTALFSDVNSALAMMEKQQAFDPNFPKIVSLFKLSAKYLLTIQLWHNSSWQICGDTKLTY